MQNRYSPPSAWLKDMVDSGRLGRIHMVQVNCFWNRDDRYYGKIPWKGTLDLDGGTLFTQFSHFIDILYWLFGDIHGIQARFADFTHSHNTDFEDSGLVTFDFVQGGMGTLQFSTAVAETNFESSLTIVAEKGTVKVGGQYMNEVEYCRIEGYEMPELRPQSGQRLRRLQGQCGQPRLHLRQRRGDPARIRPHHHECPRRAEGGGHH